MTRESAVAKTRRDVTRALEIAKALRLTLADQTAVDALIVILTDLDARTGKRDPSVRRA